MKAEEIAEKEYPIPKGIYYLDNPTTYKHQLQQEAFTNGYNYDKWISVEDEDNLPNNGKRVLIKSKNGFTEIGEMLNGRFVVGEDFEERTYTTHWMELPE